MGLPWKSSGRRVRIWRATLLMVVASISIALAKEELDEFYEFVTGEDVKGRAPSPSLSVMMTAERKGEVTNH